MTDEQLHIIEAISLAVMVLLALWSVMTTFLLRAVVGLALTSALVATLMFLLGAPMAAVFELSVCAGLIPAIFLSAISITRRQTALTMVVETRQQIKQFWFLPVLVIMAGVAMTQVHVPQLAVKLASVPDQDVREVLWNLRHLDLLGQIIILLGGAFGVVALVREVRK